MQKPEDRKAKERAQLIQAGLNEVASSIRSLRDSQESGIPQAQIPQSEDRIPEAIDRLATVDARQAKMVVLRFFGGLDYAEIGEALGTSERTVKRDWKHAQAWLYAALGGEKP